MRKRVTESEIAKIAGYASQNMNPAEIARRVGLGRAAVDRIYAHLQRVGHMGSYRVTTELPPVKALKRARGATSTRGLCLSAFDSCETILSVPEIYKVVTSVRPDCQAGIAYTALSAMSKKGLVERVIKGHYRLTPAGAAAKKT